MDIAGELSCSPTQVAIKWVQQGPANIIPLVGARTLAQWQENLGCLELELPDEAIERLNDVSQISPGFPHDMLSGQQPRKLENHRRLTSGGYLD